MRKNRKTVQKCVSSFLYRDYFAYIKHFNSVPFDLMNVEILQMFLISLQRLGKTEMFEKNGNKLLTGTADEPWSNALLQLTLGHTDIADALKLACNKEQLCQAHYYAGIHLLHRGSADLAEKAFKSCRDIGAECLETHLAKLEWLLLISPHDKEYLRETITLLYRKNLEKAAKEVLSERIINSLMRPLNASPTSSPPEGQTYSKDKQKRGCLLSGFTLWYYLRSLTLNMKVAKLYQQGRYEQAISLAAKVENYAKSHLGEKHYIFAQSLNNLGELYRVTGRLADAEPLIRQALEIRRKALGDEHPQLASSLTTLAGLCEAMGNFGDAETFYQQSLEIDRKVLGEKNSVYVSDLINLAALHKAKGDFFSAEPLFRQALEICRKSLGPNHPHYPTILNSLATLCLAKGEFADAESFYKQASSYCRAAFGNDHPNYATSQGNLALLYCSMGKYTAAEPLSLRALEITGKALGKDHLSYAIDLINLAALYAAQDRVGEAMPLMVQAAAIDDRMIGQVFSISSETQRTAYLKTVRAKFDGFLSLVSQYLSHSPEAVLSALSLVLRRKAIEAEALATQRDAVLGGKYPEVAPKLKEVTTLRAQIAQKTLAGPGKEGLQAHQQLLAEWNTRKERLEAEVARQVPEMNLEQKLRSIDHQVVAMAMPAGATLIEFVRFDVADFKAVSARGEQRWQPARYLVFVMPAGEPENIEMIDLGEAEPIDQMIATFREVITGEEEDRNRGMGRLPSSARRATGEDVGLRLCEAIFTPLLKAIGNRKRLMISPDGDLTRLPFEVLPADDGRRLIDEYKISYLGAGRDVVRFDFKSNREPSRSLVAADPDFNLGARSLQAQAAAGTGRRSRDLKRDAMATFDRLPGTKLEGESIAAMLDAKLWTEGEALDARLKKCRSPRILHLATHGFFLEDQKRDPNEDRLGLGAMSFSESGMERLVGSRLENPLLRSGLVLAGVNTWLKRGELMEEAEDGLLTAEDVSGLDLLDTELVVLSACETGLGEVRVGEGVFGLRRAFVLAGAKTLVMSLWKVLDLATAILMERFYNNLLNCDPTRRRTRSEALREAQFYTRDVTVGQIRDHWLNAETIKRLSVGNDEVRDYLEWLAQQVDDYQPFTHPRYWGAFICQGDPGPLSQQG